MLFWSSYRSSTTSRLLEPCKISTIKHGIELTGDDTLPEHSSSDRVGLLAKQFVATEIKIILCMEINEQAAN